jgi:hypothetical protein
MTVAALRQDAWRDLDSAPRRAYLTVFAADAVAADPGVQHHDVPTDLPTARKGACDERAGASAIAGWSSASASAAH